MDVLLIAAAMLASCGALGWYAAKARWDQGGKVRIVVTFIAAWCLGTLFLGVPGYAVGWIASRHSQKRSVGAAPSRAAG